MSRSDQVSRTFEFFRVFGAAEKNEEKVEANCTGFSADFFGSQSVEMFGFARKTKIQMLTTSCWSLTRIHQLLLKSLRLHLLLIPYPLLFVHVVIEWPLSCSTEPISTTQFLAEVFFQGVEWWQTDKQIDRVPLWFHSKRIQPNSGPSKSVKVSNHRNYASNFETTSTPSCPPLLNSSSLQYVWQIKNVKYSRLHI